MNRTTPFAALLVRAGLALAGVFSLVPPAGAIEYWLRAQPLALSLPGAAAAVPMWGYARCADASFSSCDPATVPGPSLRVPVGDPVLTIHLRNDLPSSALINNATSIVIPGQTATMTPVKFTDGSGRERVRSFTHETLPGGGTGDYSWTAMKPGTYLYHSGSHPQVQVQMGLYGGVAKNHAAGTAYPGVGFASEVTLLYSEIDPVLHAAVAGGTYDPAVNSTLDYQPRHFLVNGRPYQAGDPALATLPAGQPTLLRFLNAGLQTRVPVVNGLTMKLVAEDGKPYPWPANPREQYSVLLPAAKTVDAVVVPTAGAGGAAARYAVYDRRMGLTNDGAPDGGMLALLDVVGASVNSAPVARNDAYSMVQGGSLTVAAPGVLANDSDPDAGDTVTAVNFSAPSVGSLSVSANGGFTFNVSTTGLRTFTYQARDSSGATSNVATVSITVSANRPPVAVADFFNAPARRTTAYPPRVLTVLANDSDPDTALDPGNVINPATIVITTAPTRGGTATPNANGTISYVPRLNYTGLEFFSYRVRDSRGGLSNSATVRVTVQ